MEPTNNLTVETQNLPVAEPTPPIETPKKQKRLLWVLGIISLLAVVAAITFAILFFTKSTPEQPVDEPETTKEETSETTEEESEITDETIISSLDEIMSILHGDATQTGPTFIFQYGIHNEKQLYLTGNLSEVAKVAHLVGAMQPDLSLSSEQKESVISEQGLSAESAQVVRDSLQNGIKRETLGAKYLEVFGEEIPKESINNQRYCPGVKYNNQYDFYYMDVFGCGGTGPYTTFYYKNKYTKNSEHAYVYVSAGEHDSGENKVYCDIINIETPDTFPTICSTSPVEVDSFTIDESNYQDFAEYRFVFNLADNGTYYFSKVEKL